MLKSVTCENLGCGILLVITSYEVGEMNFSSCSVGGRRIVNGTVGFFKFMEFRYKTSLVFKLQNKSKTKMENFVKI